MNLSSARGIVAAPSASAGLRHRTTNSETAKPEMNAQQSKMATCNKEASGKKGDERKKFMSECLKAK